METTNVILNEKGLGIIELLSGEKKAGRMEISVIDNLLTVYHTEVDPEFSGKGFAKLLLGKLVSYARENNLKIKPLCPFVHAQFKRNPEQYDAVWFKNES